jgi:hypothetical protein
MTPRLQTYIALFVVVVAVALLIWRPLSRKKRPGCGGGCGCPTDAFKADRAGKLLKK